MRLIEEAVEHDPEFFDTVRFLDKNDESVFTYNVETHELWNDWEDPYGPPIAHPETLEQVRTIIAQNGYTIS